jgi:predicted DCC family thiol-disulfide oxidoreductase YuxK
VQEHPIILFDGMCNLCSGAVQWIIRHDKKSVFRFASLQGEVGSGLKQQYTHGKALDSIILIENGEMFSHSTAALRIARRCDGLWKVWYMFMVLPKFLRDPVYTFIANNRYRWFGVKKECWIPTPELRQRFLDFASNRE